MYSLYIHDRMYTNVTNQGGGVWEIMYNTTPITFNRVYSAPWVLKPIIRFIRCILLQYTGGEHLQIIALKPSTHDSSHNITLQSLVRGTVFPRTHFGSRPNWTPRGTSVLTRTEHSIFRAHCAVLARSDTSVLARTEHPAMPAGISGVPLQAGLAPGNSILDYPVFPAGICSIYGAGCPARTGVPRW